MENLVLDWYYYTPTEDDDPCTRLTAMRDGEVIMSVTRFTPEECYTELLEHLGYAVKEYHTWEGEDEDSY